MQTADRRWEEGRRIAKTRNQIRSLGFGSYEVRSQKTHKWQYIVSKQDQGAWNCTCPDFELRLRFCKHIYSVIQFYILERKVLPRKPRLEGKNTNSPLVCPRCKSASIVRAGLRRTKVGFTQRYGCKDCHLRFIPPTAFLKLKSTPQVVTASLDLYFKGCSLHAIKDHLDQFYGVKVSHVAVLKWIRKYTRLMGEFADQLTPEAFGIWHVDEMMVKIRRTRPMSLGNPPKKEHYAWLWNLMDRQTRFLLASQIHKSRGTWNARRVFDTAKSIVRTTPVAVVHDGLTSYDDAFVKEFYTNTGPQVTNIRSVGATKEGVNQLVERMNGTIRDRESVMRGMHSDQSAQSLMEGNRLYYNFLRPHRALGGKTPAQAAGIELGLEGNRWSSLIDLAYANKKMVQKRQASNR